MNHDILYIMKEIIVFVVLIDMILSRNVFSNLTHHQPNHDQHTSTRRLKK